MAQAAEKVLEFPAGGIADFYMEDDDIAAMEQEEAKKAFGDSGIANFSDVASRMASYGRGGDDTIAHVATGEIVIPLPLIENNPEMKSSIFKHLEELGIEDPEQYVVGSSANSINPETGLREFGWLSKTFKKVTRAVKKVGKSVVKLVKKAAPVIIPFALNAMFPGLGAIYSGALGSGIGTLVQGGSLKDAFKNAMIGGAIGGATAAISGGVAAAAKPGGSFAEGAMSGIKNAAKVSNLTTAGEQLVSGQFGRSGYDAVTASKAAAGDQMFAGLADAPPTVAQEAATATDMGQTKFIEGTNIPNQGQSVIDLQNQAMTPRPEGLTNANLTVDASGNLKLAPSSSSFDMSTAVDLPTKPPGFFESVKGALTPGDNVGFLEGMGDAFLPSGPSITPTELMAKNPGMSLEMAKQAIADATPGLARTLLPAGTVATIGGGIALNKMMGEDPEDDPTTQDLQEQLGPTGEDLIAQNPGQYLVTGNTEVPVGSTGQYVIPTDFAYAGQNYYNQNPFLRARGLGGTPFVQQAAEGGQIFPRRVGGIMPNEGVPGQDSVRAMLMPGEFVMTTDAVKGLGNGNNEQGINRMYDMMRGLEAKGKAMA